MFFGLRHDAVITRHHQQGVIDTAHTRQHIREKFLVARHINKSDHAPVILRPVGVAQIDGHTAFFLFRQAIGVNAGQRLQ